jgi:hypothetical protein
VNPGSYAIVVEAEGRPTRKYETVLVERQAAELEVEPGPAGDAAAAPVQPAPAPPVAPAPQGAPPPHAAEAPPKRAQVRPTTIAAFAAGGACVLVGTVTGIMALNEASTVHDHCPGGVCDSRDSYDAAGRARGLALVSTIAFGAGVIATGLGIYDLTRKGPVRAAASVGPRSASLTLLTVF